LKGNYYSEFEVRREGEPDLRGKLGAKDLCGAV
jgi:hypothetical protein